MNKKIQLIKILCIFLTYSAILWPLVSFATIRYGETLCHNEDYFCLKVQSGETWKVLFPEPEQRDILKRINRMNIQLRPGMTIAIPKKLDRISIYDVAPFPRYINGEGEKRIYISQKDLAWGAYDEEGELIWWGPISSGSDNCNGTIGGCHTPTGEFRVIRKQDIDCISTEFPRNADGTKGGAEMPYCMHFYRGYALHGSAVVPGFRDSHGCIRLFTEDARWLNEDFIDIPGDGYIGTRVIVGEIPNAILKQKRRLSHH